MRDFFYIFFFTLFIVFSMASELEQEERFAKEIKRLEKEIETARAEAIQKDEAQSDLIMNIINGRNGEW